MIEALIFNTMSAYAITFVVTSSSLFEPFRERFMKATPKLKIGNQKHMIECRMCTGFWAALLVCNTDWKMIMSVYGLSYFLATQERK